MNAHLKNPKNISHILVTVAYNEEDHIEQTIKSVIKQTFLPKKWFIVSDGSTDHTDKIIQDYSEKFDFIEYARQEKKGEYKNRLEKVTIAQSRAMKLALDQSRDLEFDFIGNLDADITFGQDYYKSIIHKMMEDPGLGLAGGGAYNVNPDGSLAGGGFIKPDFVGGPVQLFRRKCLEDIGGYAPYGHADCVAVASAKMNGWKVQCFPEIRAFHHGLPGYTVKEKVPDCFKMGQMDYIMGGLFLYQIARCVRRMFKKPFFIAGLSMLFGYIWAFLKRRNERIPKDLIHYIQSDQKQKLLSILLLR